MSKITVGFFSSANYFSRNTFSGTLFYMYQALKKHNNIEVVPLGSPHEEKVTPVSKALQILKWKWAARFPKTTDVEKERFFKLVDQQLQSTTCDLIFAPVCNFHLATWESPSRNLPIIYLTDATPSLLKQYYGNYSDPKEYEVAAMEEKLTFQKSRISVFSSQWVAQSAVNEFQAPPDCVKVIPFGANLDYIPPAEMTLTKLGKQPWQLLFIGKSWSRKGGNIAYETFLKLISLGINVKLTMIGSVPPENLPPHPQLKIIPFLDKNNPEEQQQLVQRLLASHLLLFPSQADCSPIALCEAAAYGIPVLATDVGGIPEIIHSGKNGFMLPVKAPSQAYADKIKALFSDPERYKNLVINARQEYDSRLNWSAWAEKMYNVFQEALAVTDS